MKMSSLFPFTSMKPLIWSAVLCANSVFANASWEAETGAEFRWFPQHSEKETTQHSAFSRIEFENRLGGTYDLAAEIFARRDPSDRGRNHLDIREMWLTTRTLGLEIGLGVTREFWGVTESHHLVNILNQVDQVEDVDAEDFLGQPALKVTKQWGATTLSAYALPYFREREHHEEAARLSSPIKIGTSTFESGAEKWHVDTVLRWSTYLDWLDIGVSYFEGTDREPLLRPQFSTAGEVELQPHYHQIQQIAVDAQITLGAWLFKFEALQRRGYDETFHARVLGFEYTFFQLRNTNLDLGFIVEHAKDNRTPFHTPVTLHQDDLFVALRLGFNNNADTAIVAGSYFDQQNHERIHRLELDHRLNDRWTVSLRSTALSSPRRSNPLFPIRTDDFVSLTVTAHLGG